MATQQDDMDMDITEDFNEVWELLQKDDKQWVDIPIPKDELPKADFDIGFEPVVQQNKRYKTTTEAERDAILSSSESDKTKNTTKYAVASFKNWLVTNGKSEDFETLPLQTLNKLLEVYYAEVKSIKGTELSKGTFVTLRAGLSRHINSPPYKRNIVIMSAPEFSTSNRMFAAVLKKGKKQGNDQAKHFPPISALDLEKLRDPFAFDEERPTELQQKVFFDTQLIFARRGRENLRNLTKHSFTFATDDMGLEYCEMAYNEHTKNHQTMEGAQARPRMYENKTDTCPIASLKS